MRFSLDVLYLCETHFQFVDSKKNRCMIFLAAKQACDIIFFSSEVYVRILTNQIVSFSNDLLCISGEYGLSTRHTKLNLCLDSSANFICGFYFAMSKLLRVYPFVDMYEKFVPNFHYLPETFKIISKSYLEYCSKKFKK